MTDPLALVLYDKLMPGSALVNRLQDLKYRVQTINTPAALLKTAQEAKPLIVLADIESNSASVCDAIAKLKATKATSHLPVIGFGHDPGLFSFLHMMAIDSKGAIYVGETIGGNRIQKILTKTLPSFGPK